MISSISNSLQSYIQTRINSSGDDGTITIGGKTYNKTTGQEQTGTWGGDTVNLSPDAQKALTRLSSMADQLDVIYNVAGGRKMTQAEQYQVLQLTSQLDEIYGTSTIPTSEAYLSLSDNGHANAGSLLTQLQDIYTSIGDGQPNDEQTAQINDLIGQLDTLLDTDNARASHTIASLPAEQQRQVIDGLTALQNIIDSADGSLSKDQQDYAVQIARSIDATFDQYGKAKPFKELTDDEQTKANKLLAQLGDVFQGAGQSSMKNYLATTTANNTATFLSLLAGKGGGQSTDQNAQGLLGQLNSGSSSGGDLYSFLTNTMPQVSTETN
ncbi:MAG: hypothetical protein GC134_07065 [Proteobacteria bacterium]|nr:hypothetical protein [Pseudomonadota bacterium]